MASPVPTDPERTLRDAAKDGAAAGAAERAKRTRYPYPNVAPVAVETLSRLGPVAFSFAMRWATRAADKRTGAVTAFYRGIARALQQHNADRLLSAVD